MLQACVRHGKAVPGEQETWRSRGAEVHWVEADEWPRYTRLSAFAPIRDGSSVPCLECACPLSHILLHIPFFPVFDHGSHGFLQHPSQFS